MNLSPFRQVAVRAWAPPIPEKARERPRRARPRKRTQAGRIRHALLFDTETTTDETQALLFGAYRYVRIDEGANGPIVTTVAEGLIYADDLPETDPRGYRLLRDYVASHKADVDLTYLGAQPSWSLQLLSRHDFTNRWLWHVGYPHHDRRDPAAIVCFNAPFDFSRIAVDVAEARWDMRGGFSFTIWTDDHGQPAPFRPRLAVKNLDSKRALKKFRRLERGKDDHAGHLLDLRTLVFALTGESHSLDSACRRFGVEGKAATPELGTITVDAVDYCRQDVRATTTLFEAVLSEYLRHPIALQPTQAYSPASIAKSYLDAMGVQPRLRAQPDFPPEVLGQAMSAFYGGRAEVHIRHVPVPVQVLDFTSMYPTVDTLMGIWHHVIAREINTVDATAEVEKLLERVTLQDCFDPALWHDLVVIVEIVPDGDVVPVRADYRPEDWSIGVNHLHADQPFWYTLPDLIAAKLLSGHTPQIRSALRFVPSEPQDGLRAVALRGDVAIDPYREDFFQRVVELRQQLRGANPDHDPRTCPCDPCGTSRFLKVLANSGSYGIYAEMIRQEQPGKVDVYGQSGEPFTTRVEAPERPGTYCFPPIAACITSAARLMLALLERSITDIGGTWVFCDTDSMAIAATASGGELIDCPGGHHQTAEGAPTIRTLGHADVETIRRRFDRLNPYNRTLVPGVLKVEETGTCYAISAKRYVIYQPENGKVRITKRSEHGLARYLDPRADEDGSISSTSENWIAQAWEWIIAAHHDPEHPTPAWADRPALSRVTVSSPVLERPFRQWNRGKPWAARIKPFNFLLVADTHTLGRPPGAEPHRFRLIAPYNRHRDGRQLEWRNHYDPNGPAYRVTTVWALTPEQRVAVVKSYGQVLREYRLHPEHKFDGPDGSPCRRNTKGILQRREVRAVQVNYIGKEANRLDDVQAGLVADGNEVVTEYPAMTDAIFRTLVLPVLERNSGRTLAAAVGSDRRTIDRIRAGQKPRAALRQRLEDLALVRATAQLEREAGRPVTALRPVEVLAAWCLARQPRL